MSVLMIKKPRAQNLQKLFATTTKIRFLLFFTSFCPFVVNKKFLLYSPALQFGQWVEHHGSTFNFFQSVFRLELRQAKITQIQIFTHFKIARFMVFVNLLFGIYTQTESHLFFFTYGIYWHLMQADTKVGTDQLGLPLPVHVGSTRITSERLVKTSTIR